MISLEGPRQFVVMVSQGAIINGRYIHAETIPHGPFDDEDLAHDYKIDLANAYAARTARRPSNVIQSYAVSEIVPYAPGMKALAERVAGTDE